MKTRQKVKLLYVSPLVLISNAIRYSHATWDKSNTVITRKCKECGYEEDINSIKELSDECLNCYSKNHIIINDYLDDDDFNLIKRVGFKLKHQSVLEHSLIVYHIECSRSVLQELARHRHQSMTVKSTRYTLLKDLKNEKPFILPSTTLDCNKSEEEYIKVMERLNIPPCKSDIDRIRNYQKVKKRASKYLVLTQEPIVDFASIKALEEVRKILNENNKPNDIVKYSLPECFKTSLQLSLNLRSLIHLLQLRLDKSALWEFRQIAYLMYQELPDDYKELLREDETIKKHLIRCKDEGFNKLIKSD